MRRKRNINRKLKMFIAGSGLTSYEIELEADIPLTKLSRIIHGAAIPSEDEKNKIATALNVDPIEIFQEEEQPLEAA